jgi:hypothetical protein
MSIPQASIRDNANKQLPISACDLNTSRQSLEAFLGGIYHREISLMEANPANKLSIGFNLTS